MSTNGKIAYILSLYEYGIRPEEERDEVESWLRSLGVDPRDVSISDRSASLTVWSHFDESLELDIWLVERDKGGRALTCPTCPSCVRQKRVKVPVTEPVPSVFGARRDVSAVLG